jgi:cell division protease FtsH
VQSTIKTVVFWAVIVVSAYLLWQVVKSGGNVQAPEISYSEFLSQTESGNVGKVTISGTHITGIYRDSRTFRVTAPTSQEGMLQTLHQKNVEIWFRDSAEGNWPSWLLNLAPLILLAALWFFMIRQMKQRRPQTQINNQP